MKELAVTSEHLRAIVWAMFWRITLVSSLAGLILNNDAVLHFIQSLGPLAQGALLFGISAVFSYVVHYVVLKIILRKRFAGFRLVLVEDKESISSQES